MEVCDTRTGFHSARITDFFCMFMVTAPQVAHLASLVRQIDVVPEREFDVIELHTHYFRDPEL